MKSASLFRRMAAWIYEAFLLFALCALVGLLFTLVTQSTDPLTHHIALSIVLFSAIGIYFTWFWSKGQTLAMKTWGIQIVDKHQKPLSIRLAAIRYLLAWLWFAPPLLALLFVTLTTSRLYIAIGTWVLFYMALALLHPSKQFLHDRLLRTQIVELTR